MTNEELGLSLCVRVIWNIIGIFIMSLLRCCNFIYISFALIDEDPVRLKCLFCIFLYICLCSFWPLYDCFLNLYELYIFVILNNLSVNDVPKVILSLHEFEKLLTQRDKAFQTVLKMELLIKKYLKDKKYKKLKVKYFIYRCLYNRLSVSYVLILIQ